MNNRFTIILIFLLQTAPWVYAQKKLITNHTHKTWHDAGKLEDFAISANGEYIWYKVGTTLNVYKSNGQPVQKLGATEKACFTSDSKTLVFIQENKLYQLDLKTLSVQKLPYEDASSAVILSEQNTIVLTDQDKRLVVWNIKTGKVQTYEGITEFKVNDRQLDIVAKKDSTLCWIDLKKNQQKVIAKVSGIDFNSVKFSNSENSLLFSASQEDQPADKVQVNTVYYYYDKQMPRARLLLDVKTQGLPSGYQIEAGSPSFNKDGSYVYFKLQPEVKKEKKDQPYISMWHYKKETYVDDFPHIAFASLAVKPGARVQVLGEGQLEMIGAAGLKYVLLKKKFIRDDDLYWNKELRPKFTLVSMEDGNETQVLTSEVAEIAPKYPQISPNDEYIIWFDYAVNEYLTYNISTGKIVNITKDIHVPADLKIPLEGSVARKMLGWPEEWIGMDDAVILRDQYDIWQVDPSGQKPAISLTGGYGRRNNIEFQLTIATSPSFTEYIPLTAGHEIILRAMNVQTGDNGFYQIRLGRENNFEEGHLHPCLFSWTLIDEPKPILKARKANVFVVTRQTAAEAPNLYVTTDLKSYKKLTDIAPQKDYNWMTSELINYPMKGGRMNRAILFKPENFNPLIKYPVIFNYYQKRSGEAHRFRNPRLFKTNIDVAWYVSNGYLVCMPDIINDEPGKIAKTTVNAVESAIDYLAQYPWFDTTKLGCQGQSFGGYETNILVTNSNRFAAANAMAANSNLFSAYFGTKGILGKGGEKSVTWFYEMQQTNLHATPWSSPQTYIENSPIMQADKVTTPLLMVHNRRDGAVPFNQAYEFFYALRRLKKPVWLFEYEGGHTEVGSDASCLDFMIRQEQFFDHYLKGKPAPEWMIK